MHFTSPSVAGPFRGLRGDLGPTRRGLLKTESVIVVSVPKRRITIGYEDYCIKWVYEKKNLVY